MILIDDLNAGYGKRAVLNSISMKIGKNSVILGHNGSGKTTLVKALCGILKINGTIQFDKDSQKRGKLPVVSNLEEIFCFAQTPRDVSLIYSHYSHMENADFKKYLDIFGIPYLYDKDFREMSTGEQKIVFSCMAFASSSMNTLLDEPFENLDPKRRRIMINQIRELKSTTVIVTHEIGILNELDDWDVYVMHSGKIHGPAKCSEFLRSKPIKGSSEDSIMTIGSDDEIISFVLSDKGEMELYGNIDEMLQKIY